MRNSLAIIILAVLVTSSKAALAEAAAKPQALPASKVIAAAAGAHGTGELKLPALGEGLPPDVFAQTINAQRPLSPEQVILLRGLKDNLDRAGIAKPGGTAKPASSTINVSMSPSVTLPPVRLDLGIVTSLVFVDSTGAPWPIVDFAVGDKDALFYPEPKMISDRRMNILTIGPRDSHITTNVSVLLEGAPAPIVITALSGQKHVDFRVDMVVNGRGPNAQKPVMDAGFEGSIPADLLLALDGKPSEGAEDLVVSGDRETRAWKRGKNFIVRTRLTITAPAALRMGHAVDGVKVYEIPETPYLLALRDGDLVNLKLSGY